MIKKFTLLMVALLLSVMGVNAKTRTTKVLWEGTSEADAEINISKDKFSEAASGDMIRITFSFTTAGSMHLCWKTGTGGDWSAKAFNGISEWPNFSDTSVSSAEFSVNATDLTTLQSYGMYIYGFASSTITKIELIHSSPTGETELCDAAWKASWTAKTFPAQSSAKIGDVIRVQYTANKDDATDWPWVQFYFMDGGGNNLVDPVAASKQKNAVTYFEFEIVSADVLAKIQTGGFSIKGDQFVLNSVKLLTYADSYDAVSITVGSDGVATYSNGGKNVQISACDGLKAYYASAVAEGIVTLTELTGCIPANTGVIVYGSEGTYTVPVGGEGWPSITTNYLKPTGDSSAEVAASTTGTYHYIFAKNSSDEIGFYKLAEDYSRVTTEKEGDIASGTTVYYHRLAAHKAYLETTKDFTPPAPMGLTRGLIRLSFGGGEGTTAINTALKNPIVEDGLYYTLQGVAVKNPSKGIYILNGKKVFVK